MNSNEIIDLINKKELEIKRLQIEVEELKRNLNNQVINDTELSLSREEKVKIFMNYFRGRDNVYPYLSIDKNNEIFTEMLGYNPKDRDFVMDDGSIQPYWKSKIVNVR